MFFKILFLVTSLELGFVNGGIMNYSLSNIEWINVGALYTKLDTTINYKNLFIVGQIDTYFTPISWNNYYPFQLNFILKTGFKYENLLFGYEHSCFHPMQPYATIMDYEIKPKYEGGYNKFYIQFKL